ncbi:sulfite reductase subunit beta [Aeromicrobium chenweiae]|uniref:Sulfite reductase subunit beta n=1 Tax=Aeromicrobium chenweiae TaxID=2079793 RepID=A0A2S0WQN4_9ACTN|nr:sulfite reductase subunit beta [Aeromicrobium chenweiae]AWB93627.1 sulfite reductase subunit beta [Aeromicrobium chenweiae]TGN33276.1 sulfite reductase subunit beta [Aeromicrobium chenweiae]
MSRTYTDRCPGVLRPWIADDGAIVRLRLVGGMLPARSLPALVDIAEKHADGSVLLTKRTNLQLRGIAHEDGCVSPELVDALTDAGFLPSPSHELVRNIMVSPLTGRVGGQADLRGLATDLDRRICAEPELARLAGRFLFVLDDGRGDIGARSLDLGVTAVDPAHVQLRVGTHHWGEVVAIDEAAEALVAYAMRFLDGAGTGDTALWHVDELPRGGAELLGQHHARDVRTQVTALPLPYGIIAQGGHLETEHVTVPDGRLRRDLVEAVTGHWAEEVIVTPWRSILLPDLDIE